jgi:hypothetical protein
MAACVELPDLSRGRTATLSGRGSVNERSAGPARDRGADQEKFSTFCMLTSFTSL